MSFQFKVTAWNVENYFHPRYEGNAPKGIAKASAQKSNLMVQVIYALNSDLFFLSEMGGEVSFRFFCQDDLENNFTPYVMQGNSDRDIQIGFILKKNSAWKMREFKTHPKRELPGLQGSNLKPYFERDLAEIHLTNNLNQHLICLGVHLKSQREFWSLDSKGAMKRAAEILGLVERVKELEQKYPESMIFIMGDFNGLARSEGDPEFQPLLDLKYAEVQNRATFAPELRSTFLGYDGKGSQLDYLYFPPKLDSFLQVEESGPYNHWAPNFSNPSDHLPLTASFKS